MGEISAEFPPNMHPQSYITAMVRRYKLPAVFYVDLWPAADPWVVLTEPELMDAVQVTRAYDNHPLAEATLRPFIGPNVVATVNGPVWKRLHGAMAPAFLPSHVRTLTTLMAEQTLVFRERLAELARATAPFSFEHESARLVFDVIGQLVFHFPLHAQTPGGSAYLDDLKEITRLVNASLSRNPLARAVAWLRRNAVRRRLDAAVSEQIRARLAHLRDENVVPSRRDFLSILDLMLRDTLIRDGEAQDTGAAKMGDLPQAEMDLLVTK
jgi:cytochrome P450